LSPHDTPLPMKMDLPVWLPPKVCSKAYNVRETPRLNPEIRAQQNRADKAFYRLRTSSLSVQSEGLVQANELRNSPTDVISKAKKDLRQQNWPGNTVSPALRCVEY
jgi:hypothetical protein